MNPLKYIEFAKDVQYLAEHIIKLESLLRGAQCPSNCDDGAIQLGGGDIEQCQFCYERDTLLEEENINHNGCSSDEA